MEGFDAVIFAYGQTASGKTFTLVSLLLHLPLWYVKVDGLTDWHSTQSWYHPTSGDRHL